MDNMISMDQRNEIPEWILRHDETLSKLPAITRATKRIRPILMDRLKASYLQANSSIDLLHETFHAAEIMASAEQMKIRISNAIARYAAIRTVLESLRPDGNNSPWSDVTRWRLLLRGALLLDTGLFPESQLYLSWIEAARTTLLKPTTTDRYAASHDPLPYDCFDAWGTATDH